MFLKMKNVKKPLYVPSRISAYDNEGINEEHGVQHLVLVVKGN